MVHVWDLGEQIFGYPAQIVSLELQNFRNNLVNPHSLSSEESSVKAEILYTLEIAYFYVNGAWKNKITYR